jgi:hypothetical protein
MMTVCPRCLKEFEEPEASITPIEELGQIFLKNVNGEYADKFCPECKKELGILNLLGFGE